MLLTISQPTKTEFGGRSTHDFSPRLPFPRHRVSPKPRTDSPVSSLRVSATSDNDNMSTSHRGLPPPSAMTLPDPSRQPPPSLGPYPGMAMPSAPSQWQGQEESMRSWLIAKAEEDKRKQEEEKTRQEGYRLDQRRIEQEMLRESLRAGVPPTMIPMIYAGIGGSNLANVSMDMLQQYASQLQQAQAQLSQQPSPEMRRETRLISQAPPYGNAQVGQQQIVPNQVAEQSVAPIQTTFSAYQPIHVASGPTSAPRSATHTQLPRLTTNEMYVHQPVQANPGSAHPLQQSQTIQQDQPTSSPSIYFHHWVPPNESSKNQPQTPASRGDREPHSAHPGSHRSDNDFRDSPRKRKAQGGHGPNPPPSAGPAYTSPSFSTASSASRKGDHGRSRSNASLREPESRPDSRRDAEPQRASQPSSGHLGEEARRPRDSPQQMHRDRDERLGPSASMEAQQQREYQLSSSGGGGGGRLLDPRRDER